MPIVPGAFYSKEDVDEDGSTTSESRWGSRLYDSSVVVPPSEHSEPLSAPASGFSAPHTTSSGLKPPTAVSRHPIPKTRFANALLKQQERWQQIELSAKEVLLSSVSVCESPLRLPKLIEPSSDKCEKWVNKSSGKNMCNMNDELELLWSF